MSSVTLTQSIKRDFPEAVKIKFVAGFNAGGSYA
jgi:hypothetical protein